MCFLMQKGSSLCYLAADLKLMTLPAPLQWTKDSCRCKHHAINHAAIECASAHASSHCQSGMGHLRSFNFTVVLLIVDLALRADCSPKVTCGTGLVHLGPLIGACQQQCCLLPAHCKSCFAMSSGYHQEALPRGCKAVCTAMSGTSCA